jgi:DNA invertase Pin-like site-specific DNA recombinase
MSVIEEARKLVSDQLAVVDQEKRALERALAALDGGVRRGRPPKGSKPRRQRRKGGTRRDQALGLIVERPDITASDIAKVMKIKPNYLYRVLSDLEKEKLVVKTGRKYRAA